jgi:hypothetical protein
MGDEAVALHHLLLAPITEDRSVIWFLRSRVHVNCSLEECHMYKGKTLDSTRMIDQPWPI